MLELSRKLSVFFIKLSTIASVLFLFLVMCVASFDAVNFIKILILLFTAGFLKKIVDESKEVLFFTLLGSLLLFPYTKVVFTAFGILILFDLVDRIFETYGSETDALRFLFFIPLVLISLLLGENIYPSYESNSLILMSFIGFMLLVSFTLFVIMVNLLFEILFESSRAQAD